MIAPFDITMPILGNGHPMRNFKSAANGFLPISLVPQDKDYQKIVLYIQEFLSKPHPLLGRAGDVCPFTQKAMALDTIFMKQSNNSSLSMSELSTLTEEMGEFFNSTKIGNDEYKCVLTIFPEMTEDNFLMIDKIQNQKKFSFVEKGLMLGQFHPKCEEPGLWSDEFRPLQSRIPMLAVRHMAKTDIAFLIKDERYLHAYRKKFGGQAEAGINSFKKRVSN